VSQTSLDVTEIAVSLAALTLDEVRHRKPCVPSLIAESFGVAVREPALRSVSSLADFVKCSPERLRKTCAVNLLPSPKSWLVLADGLKLMARLRIAESCSTATLAAALGYPDKFGMLRAFNRSLGSSIKDIREERNARVLAAKWLQLHLGTRKVPDLSRRNPSRRENAIDPSNMFHIDNHLARRTQ
jgi:AraC-like DNA-binding protein